MQKNILNVKMYVKNLLEYGALCTMHQVTVWLLPGQCLRGSHCIPRLWFGYWVVLGLPVLGSGSDAFWPRHWVFGPLASPRSLRFNAFLFILVWSSRIQLVLLASLLVFCICQQFTYSWNKHVIRYRIWCSSSSFCALTVFLLLWVLMFIEQESSG